MEEDRLRRGFAEFVGAFALTFVGVGSIVAGGGLVGAALAHGLVIAVMVSAVGHISGGHFNPAVTFGFLVAGRIERGMAVVYWIAQLSGAFFAALFLSGLLPDGLTDPVQLGVPAIGGGIGAGAGFVIEAILTFFLVWVVFASAVDPGGTFKSIAGLAIGFTITLAILFAGPFTGAALNPSRAFGPQLVGWYWSDGWVWYLGPLVGAALGALAYDRIYLRPGRPVPVGPPETGVDEPRAGETALS